MGMRWAAVLLAVAVLGVLTLTSSERAEAFGSTVTLELGDQDFDDGEFAGVAEFNPASVGEDPPFDQFRGSNTDAADPFTAEWTFTGIAPGGAKGAFLRFGICDHDAAADGDQVASFTIDGVDNTAGANTAFNFSGGTQVECNHFTFFVPAEDLADGSVTASLTLQGPSIGGDPGQTPTTGGFELPGNGAGLDFSTLEVVYNKPSIKKDPHLANLWLCNQPADGCFNFESGVEQVTLPLVLNGRVGSPDPKCTGFPTFSTDPESCPRQTIGAFEFEVRYDAKLVTLDFSLGDLWFDSRADCALIEGEGFAQVRCNTKGKDGPPITGPGTLLNIHVRPTPDVYSILIPNQLNGIATQLINQDCQLADTQGHPIPFDVFVDDPCQDAAVTIRYLEGDVHADCEINVHDQQQIAFRWGSRLGSLLYNDRYDLEPSLPKKGDGDIDAKDLQLVYGRFGSSCKAPHPAQDPVDPKVKVGPPPPTD